MLHLHPSRDLVYAVLTPVPDPLHAGKTLAEPGDELVVRAHDDRWPITVLRRLPIDASPFFPDDAVRLCASYEATSDAPASDPSADFLAERRLRLLPPAG